MANIFYTEFNCRKINDDILNEIKKPFGLKDTNTHVVEVTNIKDIYNKLYDFSNVFKRLVDLKDNKESINEFIRKCYPTDYHETKLMIFYPRGYFKSVSCFEDERMLDTMHRYFKINKMCNDCVIFLPDTLPQSKDSENYARFRKVG